MFWTILLVIAASLLALRFLAENAQDVYWREKALQYDRAVDQEVWNEVSRRTDPASDKSGSWSGWRQVQVHSIRDQSPSCRSLTLRSIDSQPLPKFQGGQFIVVRLPKRVKGKQGKQVSRCYSLSSGPNEDWYRITVKRVPNGVFSNQLHDCVKEGDIIEIQSPKGRFSCDPTDERPLNLIAAGIGITPMLSMIMQCLDSPSKRSIDLFYQLRNESDGAVPESTAASFLLAEFLAVSGCTFGSASLTMTISSMVFRLAESMQTRFWPDPRHLRGNSFCAARNPL